MARRIERSCFHRIAYFSLIRQPLLCQHHLIVIGITSAHNIGGNVRLNEAIYKKLLSSSWTKAVTSRRYLLMLSHRKMKVLHFWQVFRLGSHPDQNAFPLQRSSGCVMYTYFGRHPLRQRGLRPNHTGFPIHMHMTRNIFTIITQILPDN